MMKDLIIKYLSESISTNELKKLQELLKSPENQKEFEHYLEIDLAAESSTTDVDVDDALEKVMSGLHLGDYNKKKSRNKLFFRYAVAIAVIIGIFFIYQNTNPFKTSDFSTMAELRNGDILLILANGDKKKLPTLTTSKDMELTNGMTAKLSKGKISYTVHGSNNDSKELSYNELHVPYGKTFQLVLSDGTNVHLNSGSSLKYPVQFVKGMDRRVFLNGEGYFNVAKDKEHPYIVKTNDIDVTVLGTQFNISSYNDDEIVQTVLVEGTVKVSPTESSNSNTSSVILTPNESAFFNKNTKKIKIDNVDFAVNTLWLNGKLTFNDEPFGSIIKKLERKFNIKIENKYQELNNEYFSAKFSSENPDQILNVFSKIRPFKYEITKEGIIYIENPE